MIYLNQYTNNLLIEECIDSWGPRLDALSWNEKLWLLGSVVTEIGNAEEELSDESIEAAEAIRGQWESEGISLVRALADLLDDGVSRNLRSYGVDNAWVDWAVETLGQRMQQLSINDHAWVLYTLVYDLVDGCNLPLKSELDECAAWLENGGLTDQTELIKTARAIAELVQEEYQATPYPWDREVPEIA